MKKNIEAFGSMINIRQILIGVTVLLVGTLVYLVDRPLDQTYFVYSSPFNISLFKPLQIYSDLLATVYHHSSMYSLSF